MRLSLHSNARQTAQVTCRDPLGHAALDGIVRQVREAARAGKRLVVIDLRAVTHIDNESLCRLCVTLRSLDGIRLRVSGADPRVRDVLTLCAIDGLELDPAAGPTPVRRLPGLIRSFPARSRRVLARELDATRFPSRPLS